MYWLHDMQQYLKPSHHRDSIDGLILFVAKTESRVECKLCEKICPIVTPLESWDASLSAYAGYGTRWMEEFIPSEDHFRSSPEMVQAKGLYSSLRHI